MRKILNLATALLMTALPLRAQSAEPAIKVEPKVPQKQRTELYPLMYEMRDDITALQPFMVNKQKFEAKPNQAEIAKRLQSLSRLSSVVIKHKSLQSVSYRVSGEALNQHIQHTQRAFASGNTDFARWSLASVPFACASCHTQGTANPKPLWNLGEENLSGTALERADFLFATRNYDAAEKIYTRIVRSYAGDLAPPHARQDPAEVEIAVKRKITIWVRVLRDLKGAKESLRADLLNKNLPPNLRELMNHWCKQIDRVNQRAPREIKLKGENLLKLARQKIPAKTGAFMAGIHPELIGHLWISGLLYEQLNNSPEPTVVPEILYWLGVVDLSLNNEFIYAMGATYLRDCIVSYPRSAITKSCYKEYELQMAQLYTGSRGTDIPPEVLEDLKSLRTKAGMK